MESPIKKPSQGAEVSAVRRGAPWWIWVVAAAFVLNFALVIYLDLVGPILGARVAPTTSGGVFVTEIYPGAPPQWRVCSQETASGASMGS